MGGLYQRVALGELLESVVKLQTWLTYSWLKRRTDLQCVCGLKRVSASVKSVVWSSYSARLNKRIIIKKYFEDGPYEDEVQGYLVFRGGPIAECLHQDSEQRIIVLEYLYGRLPLGTLKDLVEIIFAYASMHRIAILNSVGIDAEWRQDDCCASMTHSRSDLSAVSVGDIKWEHIIFTRAGVRIVDLETWSLQRSVWFDILSLINVMKLQGGRALNLEWTVRNYCTCRGLNSSDYDLEKIKVCLRAVQELSGKEGYQQGSRI